MNVAYSEVTRVFEHTGIIMADGMIGSQGDR
jgi:hypothetical protein